MRSSAWVCGVALVLLAQQGACNRSSGNSGNSGARPSPSPTPAPASGDATSSAARDASAASTPGTATDAGAVANAARDASAPAVLTIRVINAGTTPMNILMNADQNEMMHTRLMPTRRIPDASGPAANGTLVKFYNIPELARCDSDAGLGFGGLGQPEPRVLAPNEALEFYWDGRQRREILNTQRGGVCVEIGEPEPGRYRLEFDQPYNVPICNRPMITLPLEPNAPRVIEIRCTPRPPQPGGGREEE